MSDLLASLAIPLLALLALPVVAAAAGRARIERLEAPEAFALAFALALVWSMAGGMLLRSAGWLEAGAVWAWLVAGVAVSVVVGWRADTGVRQWLGHGAGWRGLTLLVVPIVLLLLLATVPPWYRDSLVYHLALPRYFAEHGGNRWPDDNIFAAFPTGWQSALALLHALGTSVHRDPPFNPRLVGAWIMGAAALASVALAHAAGASRAFACVAGALLLLLPTVVEFGPSAYVEGSLVLLFTLALWAAVRAGAREHGDRLWLVSAVFAGLACWIKYPAMIGLVFLGLGAGLLETLRRGREDGRTWIVLVAQWFAVAALVGCPFLVLNTVTRGNPVFPTAYALFGGEGWDPWRAWAYGETLQRYGYGRDAVDYLLLPWRLFTQRSLLGGFEGSIGPLVALGAPGGVWLCVQVKTPAMRRAIGLLLGWVVWSSIVWALTVQQTRFYLIAAPALVALLAVGASRVRWLEAPSRAAFAAALVLAVQLAWSWGPVTELWQRQATTDWLAGRLTRDELLARMLPETYRATRELESFVPEDGRVWLVWMRGYTYYLHRPYRLDCVFEAWRFEALLDEAKDAASMGDALRRDGITHVLVNHRFFLQNDNADLRPGRTDLLRDRFAAALRAHELAEAKRWGSITLYRVASPEDGQIVGLADSDSG